MKLNGAAILIECLIEQGVGTVFGFPGGAVLPIYDELYKRQDRIRHVLTAHEQHAGHAADGYARASGKTGVCIATSGPGATNLVTPIATAYMDSTPIVFITGNVPQSLMGTDSFQEADISGMTMPVTKHNYLVTRVEKLADIVREAFFIASSGRPGPVLIDIPKDVQIAETEYEPAAGEALIPKLSMKHPTVQLRLEGEALERYKVKAEPRLEQAARLIAEAQKPLIYCGGGVILSGAERELAAFADLADAPVVSTLMGLGAVPADNPRMLGMLGMHGTHAANIAMQRCDLLIAVGVRFSDRALGNAETFAAQAKVLRALQESRISRVGSDRDIEVNVRVVAATNKNLREEIRKGNFREDLYHRIGVVVVRVPALREHAQDIPLLVDHFIHTICAEYHIPAKRIEEEALSELQTMPWSGNIRELRNVIERLIILSEERITPADVKAYC